METPSFAANGPCRSALPMRAMFSPDFASLFDGSSSSTRENAAQASTGLVSARSARREAEVALCKVGRELCALEGVVVGLRVTAELEEARGAVGVERVLCVVQGEGLRVEDRRLLVVLRLERGVPFVFLEEDSRLKPALGSLLGLLLRRRRGGGLLAHHRLHLLLLRLGQRAAERRAKHAVYHFVKLLLV